MYVNLQPIVYPWLIELLVSAELMMSSFSPQVKMLFQHPWRTLSFRPLWSVVLLSSDEGEIRLGCFSNLRLGQKSATWSNSGTRFGALYSLYSQLRLAYWV
jgi:hypothetical protein